MHQRKNQRSLSPEDLKMTPNTAMEMRFGPGGKRRPKASGMVEDDKKPVNLRKFRNRTEIIFGVIFSVIAAIMVAGALTLVIPSPFAADETPASAEAATPEADAPEEDGRELQGGVKVRKGIGQ